MSLSKLCLSTENTVPTALSQRVTIRVATSAFIGVNARNLHADCEDSQGREQAKRRGTDRYYFTATEIIKQQQQALMG